LQQHPLVIDGHDLDEFAEVAAPIRQHALAHGRAGEAHVLLDQFLQLGNIGIRLHRFPLNHIGVAAAHDIALLVEPAGDTATHARRKVAASVAENYNPATGHVFTAVVADALNYRAGAGVAHAETLCGNTAEEGFTTGGAIHHHIADQDVLLGGKGADFGWIDHNAATGKALADEVVGVTFHLDGYAMGKKRPQALAG